MLMILLIALCTVSGREWIEYQEFNQSKSTKQKTLNK